MPSSSVRSKSAEDLFREAFNRLKESNPKVVKHGTPVSQNNVAKEAGVDPSALRKKRYPVLINEIQAYVEAHAASKPSSKRQEVLKKRRKNRSVREAKRDSDLQRDTALSILLNANEKIVELTGLLADKEAQLANLLPSAKCLPFPGSPKNPSTK